MPPHSSSSPGDKARAVLKAAATIFLQHGFSASTTDMIQREAGVSKATVYACYANKEALFAAVIESECAAFMSTVRAIDTRSADLKATLSEMGRAYMNILLSDTGLALFRVVVAEAPRFPDLARRFYQAGPRVAVGLFAERLTVFAERGELDLQSTGSEAAARAFLGLLRNDGQLEFLTHPNAHASAAQIEHWVEQAVTLFLRAFGVAAGRSAS
jgi:AcrR family transcriptional regulator